MNCDNPLKPPIYLILEFLHDLFENRNLGYSALNTARSALSSFIEIDNCPVGKHKLVQRFMRSVYLKKPSLPKTSITWDVEVVLDYLKTLSPVRSLSLKDLTLKLTMLLLLLSGSRGQTILALNVKNMSLSYSRAKFVLGDLLKTSRPGHHLGELKFKAYAPDRRLCVLTVLKEYLKRTLDVRGTTSQLLLTFKAPHKAASRDTIRRWTREILTRAGIDMTMFTPHSTRAASTSCAAMKLSLDTILKTACWSQKSTFQRYYHKKIVKEFGDAILN